LQPPSHTLGWLGLVRFGSVGRAPLCSLADRSYAFIQYATVDEADNAMTSLPRNEFGENVSIRVHYSKSDITAKQEGRPVEVGEKPGKRQKTGEKPRMPPQPPPAAGRFGMHEARSQAPMRGQSGPPAGPSPHVPTRDPPVWNGWLAKETANGTTPLCSVRGFSTGAYNPLFTLPATLRLISKIELKRLEMAIAATDGQFSVLYFIPDDAHTVDKYSNLVRSLMQTPSDRGPITHAGVVRVTERHTVYLVPPSTLADRLLGRHDIDYMVGCLVPMPPPAPPVDHPGDLMHPQPGYPGHPSMQGHGGSHARMAPTADHGSWQRQSGAPPYPASRPLTPPRPAPSWQGHGGAGIDPRFDHVGHHQSRPLLQDPIGHESWGGASYQQQYPPQYPPQPPAHRNDPGPYAQRLPIPPSHPAQAPAAVAPSPGAPQTRGTIDENATFRNTLLLAAALLKQQQQQQH
jgi:hypothetical protein